MSTGSRLSTRAMVSAPPPPSPGSPQSQSGARRSSRGGGAACPDSHAQVGGSPARRAWGWDASAGRAARRRGGLRDRGVGAPTGRRRTRAPGPQRTSGVSEGKRTRLDRNLTQGLHDTLPPRGNGPAAIGLTQHVCGMATAQMGKPAPRKLPQHPSPEPSECPISHHLHITPPSSSTFLVGAKGSEDKPNLTLVLPLLHENPTTRACMPGLQPAPPCPGCPASVPPRSKESAYPGLSYTFPWAIPDLSPCCR